MPGPFLDQMQVVIAAGQRVPEAPNLPIAMHTVKHCRVSRIAEKCVEDVRGENGSPSDWIARRP
jgi:hypothetical protein